MKLSRSNFIKAAVSCIVFMLFLLNFPLRLKRNAAAVPVSGKQKRGNPDMKSSDDTVSVIACTSYDPGELYKAVRHGLDDLDFRIRRGCSVLIKPNILAQNTPDQCATTHPSVVDAVCRIFSEYNCSITIGESSAFYQGGGTREGFITSGIAAVAEKYGAMLLPFEATHLRKITTGKALNPFYITEAVYSNDLVINIPKMKIHQLARYTGAIKNMYGCIPGGAKQLYHKPFQGRSDYREFWGIPLVDVYEAVRPGLNILDAVWGLDENGPAANGKPKFTGLLLMSKNAVSVDVTACRVMGFDPQWIPAVREAINRKLVIPDKIAVKGGIPLVPYRKLPDEEAPSCISKKIGDYMFDQLIVDPALDDDKCNRCGICMKRCAVSAIKTGRSGFPEFNYEECIRCYCCSEYCPRGAISLHGGIVNHMIRGARSIMKI